MLIDQRIAVIGTSGIGYAVAFAAADAGAEVLVAGSGREELEATLARLPGSVRGDAVQVCDEDDIARFFASAGELDHVVSAMEPDFPLTETCRVTRENGENAFASLYWAQLFIARHAAGCLASNGSITMTSSRRSPGNALLVSIQAAIEALVGALAVELTPLRVNAVCPRLALVSIRDAARAYLYAMSDPCLTGQVLVADRGASLTSAATAGVRPHFF